LITLQLRKESELILISGFKIVTEFRLIQSLNALFAIILTDLGMIIDVRLIQFLNACFEIVITDSKLTQSIKTLLDICLIEFGILIDIRFSLQYIRVYWSIFVTFFNFNILFL
jgi:hypothetical protein